MTEWDALTGAGEEAMENAYVMLPPAPPRLRLKEITLASPRPKRKPRCSHPKQSYRGDHWYCSDCGKKMP